MGKKNYEVKYRKLAKIVNTMLLCSHIYLIIMFGVLQIRFMVAVNVLSLLVYMINYYWIGRNLHVFFGNAYAEILLHMILAYLSVGWNGGFQIYAFALILTIYYCDYLGQKIKKPSLYPRTISIIVAMLYVALYFISYYIKPLYDLKNEQAAKLFFTVNAFFVLAYMWRIIKRS